MTKNEFEILFNENLSNIIRSQIETLNNHHIILREVLPKIDINEKDSNFKLTDSRLLDEIKALFDNDSITDRTYRNIKDGSTSSSAFNIFIIIYTLNDITSKVNEKYIEYGKSNISIPLIDMKKLMIPLEG